MQPLRLPPLTLDGTSFALVYDQAEIECYYLPLARYLLDQLTAGQRAIIGIGGPPACGKTAFTALLSAVCCAAAGQPIAAAIGLDGWHYPNQYLDTHFVEHHGQSIPLRKLKGGPLSFDAASLLGFLTELRQQPRLAYPLYSRQLHDPVPAAAWIEPHHRLILVEGNYLLLNQSPWDAFAACFTTTICLNAPREQLVTALRDRHLRGGKDLQAVEQHMQFSDLPNMDLIEQLSRRADILVEKLNARQIVKITYTK